MKKIKLFLTSIFVFLFLFILPTRVNALSYKSDFVDLKSNVVFQTNEFELDLKYIEFANGTVDRPAAIAGEGRRKSSNMYYYHYVIYYYNDQKEEIGATDGYNGIWNMISASNGSYMSSFLESKNMKLSYKLSDIKYYKLFVEPSTKEMADNYNYENYKKINMNGLDPINDFNTVEMKTVEKTITPNENNNNNNNSNINNFVDTYGNGEYALTKYKVDIKVNENNTFNITEYITAYFNIDKHGIFRKIPLKNEVVRLDGTKSNNRAKISDMTVNEPFTTYNEFGYKVIKIGDPNYTLTGNKDYVINYLYNIGKDTGKEYDEFYFNLIGYEWDTTISNVDFTITMPKDFDETKLGFSSGTAGSTDNSNIEYDVDGNIISGRYNGILNASESLTVRLELPEGYFVGASNNFDLIMIIAIILPIIFASLVGGMWFKFGRDEKAIETVEFYPPEGFNSAEVGFLYKGSAESIDVVSLLIYLANKGYIKIAETEEKALFSKNKGFKITKVREYDGNNPNERLFLKGLFKTKSAGILTGVSSFKEIVLMMKNPADMMETAANEPIVELQEVTSEDLYDNFYMTLNAIVANINRKENKEKIFEKNSLNKNMFVILMITATFLLITLKPVSETSGLALLIPAILFPGIGFSLLFHMLFGNNTGPVYVNGKPSNSKATKIIFGLMFFGLFGGMPWLFMVLPGLLNDPLYLLTYVIGIICITAMLFFMQHMTKRTKYGNEILGKIRGFKNFLETAEKSKLEELVMQSPSYFYNILPFTYVLGVSDKWINKFESIAIQAPNWYSGTDTFNAVVFGDFMSSTMTSASTVMSSNSSSDSSGGGSSGGGSGGGGGGSW